MRVIASADIKSNEMKTEKIAVNEHGPAQNVCDSHSTTGKSTKGDEAENLNLSKSRFAAAVSSTISDLMTLCGYSRSRATSVLLQNIRGDNSPPSDPKIFEFMNRHGIGYEDATRVLVVSEAIRNSCKDPNVSTIQAIDELILRLRTFSRQILTSAPTFEISVMSFNSGSLADIEDTRSTTITPVTAKSSPHAKESRKRKEMLRPSPSLRVKNSTRKYSAKSTGNITKQHLKHNNFKNSLNSPTSSSHNPTTITSSSKSFQNNSQLTNQTQDFLVTERNSLVKKSKLNHVGVVVENHHHSLDNHSVVANKNIKNKASPNANNKRKRERTQHNINGTDAVLDETVSEAKKQRASST